MCHFSRIHHNQGNQNRKIDQIITIPHIVNFRKLKISKMVYHPHSQHERILIKAKGITSGENINDNKQKTSNVKNQLKVSIRPPTNPKTPNQSSERKSKIITLTALKLHHRNYISVFPNTLKQK